MIRNEEKATKKNAKNERGASLVEYALLVALIAVAAIAGIRTLGQNVSTSFSTVNSEITN